MGGESAVAALSWKLSFFLLGGDRCRSHCDKSRFPLCDLSSALRQEKFADSDLGGGHVGSLPRASLRVGGPLGEGTSLATRYAWPRALVIARLSVSLEVDCALGPRERSAS